MGLRKEKRAARRGAGWRSVAALLAAAALSALIALGGTAAAQDPFVVGGVAVTVEAGDSVSAREEAFTTAQRDALARLFQRLGVGGAIGPGDLNAAESAGVMQSLRVEEESTSPGRYSGVFEVTFRAEAVRSVLASRGLEPVIPAPGEALPDTVAIEGEEDAPGDDAADPDATVAEGVFLIVPVWRDGTGTRLWDLPNPWLDAWRGIDPAAIPVAIATPLADLEDVRLLTTDQALAAAPDGLSALAARHGADRAVVAVANAGIGGIVIELLQPGGEAVIDDPLNVTGSTTDPAVMGSAVAAVLTAISGRPVAPFDDEESEEDETPPGVLAPLAADTPGARLSLTVALDQPRDWLAIRAALAQMQPVTGARVDSLSGVSVALELGFTGSEAELATALRAVGLDLQIEPQGRVLRLVR